MNLCSQIPFYFNLITTYLFPISCVTTVFKVEYFCNIDLIITFVESIEEYVFG